MTDVKTLQTCLLADEATARQLADKHREDGYLELAAVLQRAADEIRQVRWDLNVVSSCARPEVVDAAFGQVVVGGEG